MLGAPTSNTDFEQSTRAIYLKPTSVIALKAQRGIIISPLNWTYVLTKRVQWSMTLTDMLTESMGLTEKVLQQGFSFTK